MKTTVLIAEDDDDVRETTRQNVLMLWSRHLSGMKEHSGSRHPSETEHPQFACEMGPAGSSVTVLRANPRAKKLT
jgi:hypothetical protein